MNNEKYRLRSTIPQAKLLTCIFHFIIFHFSFNKALFYIVLCHHIVVKGFKFAETELLYRMLNHSDKFIASAFIVVRVEIHIYSIIRLTCLLVVFFQTQSRRGTKYFSFFTFHLLGLGRLLFLPERWCEDYQY